MKQELSTQRHRGREARKNKRIFNAEAQRRRGGNKSMPPMHTRLSGIEIFELGVPNFFDSAPLRLCVDKFQSFFPSLCLRASVLNISFSSRIPNHEPRKTG
jgi:hypothetical protein